MRMVKNILVLVVLVSVIANYPVLILAGPFPQGYGLNVMDRTDTSISPTYQIRFMNRTSFPTGFVFGAASSAYQIEGAWNKDGKGESNWDYYTHTYPGKIVNNSNGDVAINSYYMYKEDVDLLKQANMDSYRFSISWARVIPTGKLSDGVSEAGIKYYLNLIKYLQRKGIEPSVTLFHWDIPQGLEKEYGGFLSAKVVGDYVDYVDVCFRRFGHLVKSWITFNEPYTFSSFGYDSGAFAPGHCSSWIDPTCTGGDSGVEPYNVTHNQLLAHAAAVKLYKKKYQALQKGKIGITLVSTWMQPQNSSSEADVLAAGRALDFVLGWYMDPVVFGRYPTTMESLVGERLPKFNETESSDLKGSFDFIGINYYTALFAIDSIDTIYPNPRYSTDSHANLTYFDLNGNPIGQAVGSGWIHIYPTGIWKLLTYIKDKYNNPLIYVTENGVEELNNSTLPLNLALRDNIRIVYYYQHLSHVLKAINDGCNIAGYYAWSILDNFEWASGYSVRFGIYYVDYNDGFKRYAKLSAKWFSHFLKH